MRYATTRRCFLRTGVASSALAGVGDLGFMSHLRPVSAEETDLAQGAVELRPEIAPVVRMIEETQREGLLEQVAAQINGGLSYRDLLAGLLLAGVKNVEPRPSVGHKFHTVLVVNSAHLASISSPPEHRWLPIFWALDYYKSAAARDVRERGDWTMQRIDESAVPAPSAAPREFITAMDNWDEAKADTTIVGMARATGAAGVFEQLFRYGMRDFRSIGHKAIFVANSWRTLQCIGWQHAEPVLRSLAYALLMHEGSNPAHRDAEADLPYRQNLELVDTFRNDWQTGNLDRAMTEDLLRTLRTATFGEASRHVVDLINRGASPQAIWDGLFVFAGELLMRQPAIVPLHAVTTTNALYVAYQTSGNDQTRRLVMLQNAAFLTMFRDAMPRRGNVESVTVDDLQPIATEATGPAAVDEIFANLGDAPDTAAAKVLAHLGHTKDARELIDAARLLIFLKGTNAHDYKFSSAVLEDYYHVSPEWRNTFMASNVFMLRDSGRPDNDLVNRTRAALGA